MNKQVRKQAEKDAFEQAAAFMSYGDGAGIRRKLINETVEYKMIHVPGYREAFVQASSSQDMAKHARSAKTSHRRKTVNESVSRNTKAVVTGRYENANTGLLIAGAVAFVAYKTGADKVVWRYTKRKYNQARRFVKNTHIKKDEQGCRIYHITEL